MFWATFWAIFGGRWASLQRNHLVALVPVDLGEEKAETAAATLVGATEFMKAI
jgi:hypothetical protein